MNETNKINLSQQPKFRLSQIIRIKDYFHQEINQRKSCCKKFIKYVTTWLRRQDFNCFKCIKSWSLYHFVCKCCWNTSITKNKKKKHDQTFMLAKSKLHSIETLVSQTLIDMEISHEEFHAILGRKKIWEDEKKW